MGFSWMFLLSYSWILRTTVILFSLLFFPERKKNDIWTKYEHVSNLHLCAPIAVIHYTKTSFTTWIYQNARGGSYNKFPHIRPYILKCATEVTRMYMFMALWMCVPAFWLDDFPSMGLLRNFVSWMSVMAHSCRQQPGSWSDLPQRLSHGARRTTPKNRWRLMGVERPCWQRYKWPIRLSIRSHITIH